MLLVDVSGSMAVYARMFLQYAHLLSRRGSRVETFAFATRLTRLTRALETPDPDTALAKVSRLVDRAEYKRRQSPPGPRVTRKAFGKDRRLPITNRYQG